jgi:hypothetical protein
LSFPLPYPGHGLQVVDDAFNDSRGPAAHIVHLDSNVPESSRLVDPSKACNEAVHVSSVLAGLKARADGVGTREDIVTKGRYEGRFAAKGDVQCEDVLWVFSIGSFVHGLGLVVDQLASHDDVFARRCGGFIEFDASVVFLAGLGGENEGVDLIASFGCEFFEQRACVLGVCCFCWVDHGRCRGTTCLVKDMFEEADKRLKERRASVGNWEGEVRAVACDDLGG